MLWIPATGGPSHWGAPSRVYAGYWASRVPRWAIKHNGLSHFQKRLLLFGGVLEHNFVIQRINGARTSSQHLCVDMLYFFKCFGLVPHNALIDAAIGAGVGRDRPMDYLFAEIIQDVYTGNTISIMTAGDATEGISILAGIRQGCTLGGLLLNLDIDPNIREVQGTDK